MTLSTSESDNNNVRNMENESIPTAELQLLAKLEAANKLIESDSKSLNSLQSSAHSRKSSDTSQISLNSGEYKTFFFCYHFEFLTALRVLTKIVTIVHMCIHFLFESRCKCFFIGNVVIVSRTHLKRNRVFEMKLTILQQ